MTHRLPLWFLAAIAVIPACKKGAKAPPVPTNGTASSDAAATAAGGDAAGAAPTPTPAAAGDDVVVDLSPDAELLATIGGPRLTHAEMIMQVAIAADGTPVSADRTSVRAWKPDGRLRWQSFESGRLSVFALHGDRIAVAHGGYAGGRLTVFDRDGKAGASVETGVITSIAWSPDGTKLVAAGETMVAYDAATGARAGSLKARPALVAAFAGDQVVFVARDGVYRWKIEDAAAESIAPLAAPPKAVAISDDGAVVYTTDGTAVTALTTATGASAPVAVSAAGPITRLAVSPDGGTLAVSWKGGVRVWTLGDAPVQRWERTLKLAAAPAIGFAADGKTAAVSNIGTVVRVDAATGAETPGPGKGAAWKGFTEHGQALVAVDGALAAYDLATGAKTAGTETPPAGAPTWIDSWTFDAAGKALAWSGLETVECGPLKVWRTGGSDKTLPKPSGCEDAVSPWEPGPSLVASVGTKAVTFWDPDTGKAVMTLPDSDRPLRAVATSSGRGFGVAVYGPDDHPETGFDEGTLVDLFDLATHKMIHEAHLDRDDPQHVSGNEVNVVAVLEDGTAYVGCSDGAVLAIGRGADDSPREVARLGASVNAAEVAPNGKAAALGDGDFRTVVVGARP